MQKQSSNQLKPHILQSSRYIPKNSAQKKQQEKEQGRFNYKSQNMKTMEKIVEKLED